MSLRTVVAALAISLSAMGSMALDLPVKRVNGTQQYYYAVRRGDTVFSIARALGVTRDDIVRHNPSAADGVRQGMTIYLPVSEYSSVESPKADSEVKRERKSFKYRVNKGETLFGLSHRFGCTPDDIIVLNPNANDGIKAGEYIIIPGTDTEASEAAEVPVAKKATETPDTNTAPALHASAPSQVQPVQTIEAAPRQDGITEISVEEITVEQPGGNIAVLLPLMLDDPNPSKHALLCTDFVRGMMLAADRMRDGLGDIQIAVFDTRGDQNEIRRIMADSAVMFADVIIAPEDEASLLEVERAVSDNDSYIFNILAVQDTTYLTRPDVMQANIPHQLMYAKAVEGLYDMFDGYTPVFLISKGGRSEKLAFTQYAREYFESKGITPIDMAFDGMLSQRDLESLDPTGKYVFIPASGSLSEFNKFARPLMTYRDNVADPSSIALFGYPDWTIFRNDAAEMLHNLEAAFYSRFYSDPTQAETTDFVRSFTTTFSCEPMQVVPSQAMLGYDTARYLITNMRANGGTVDPENPAQYNGIQSAFRFEQVGEAEENVPEDTTVAGPVNTALYLINYLQGNGVTTRIL
ncbi:MAG: LysM peptidoglycan-binding domain-containing protein [Bacteroidales bacterium]|nr:LysM peptidoglycan-binding domain-containing protein [Bacteroidales bacterium]